MELVGTPTETNAGVSAVEAAAPWAAALPPAAWLGGPRDPPLIELHPLIRLSLQQLAANLKYGCLLSYLTPLPPTRCYMHAHTTHTQPRQPNIFRGLQSWPVLLFFFCFVLPCKNGHLSPPGPNRRSFFTKQPSWQKLWVIIPTLFLFFLFVSHFLLRLIPKLCGQLTEGLREKLQNAFRQHVSLLKKFMPILIKHN